jgi:hypothetical protein
MHRERRAETDRSSCAHNETELKRNHESHLVQGGRKRTALNIPEMIRITTAILVIVFIVFITNFYFTNLFTQTIRQNTTKRNKQGKEKKKE